MKNYPNPSFVLLSLILLILAGCADPQKKIDAVNALPKTTIEITETLFEFGIVQQGDRIKHSFVFVNKICCHAKIIALFLLPDLESNQD